MTLELNFSAKVCLLKLLLPLGLLELEIWLFLGQVVFEVVGFVPGNFCVMGPLLINFTMLKLIPYPHILTSF